MKRMSFFFRIGFQVVYEYLSGRYECILSHATHFSVSRFSSTFKTNDGDDKKKFHIAMKVLLNLYFLPNLFLKITQIIFLYCKKYRRNKY